ncbi:MAG: PHP domain-containing protein [Firmicutes bacterium]|nr:PHP domain-containing protein [Bacillota bacterium]
MDLHVDMHTHTVASGHAYSTLRENLIVAKERGLTVFGTSDHAKAMKGIQSNAIFGNYRAIPRYIDDVLVVCGVEANIVNEKGAIDIDLDRKRVDYAIVSLHRQCYKSQTKQINTDALIGACAHPSVKIIGHPDDDRYPLDYDRLSDFIVERDLFCEVNNSSLKVNGPRQGAKENLEVLLKIGKEKGMKVIVGSDAHIDVEVGNFELAEALLEEMDYPEELIVNTWDEEKIISELTMMEK